ncbi:MFS transporter [Porphyromonas sp.]|uniref:MFS transporter n=1 Tax=Porphyromonas sp. TaxID=1924944 RepID=UPI0026DB551D|nr:MFS transporter [Porphyromonas sp.]MDO4695349.1 MFS transporter [Porphyromonas sp.]MDO4771121.1 MFS transporter [Porphyromonas sp.]
MSVKNQPQSYFVPFVIMVVLMSLIGLITSLNQQFQVPMQAAYLLLGGSYTNTLTTLLTFSFFAAYLVMGPLTSRYVERNGYKRSLIFGLIILIVSFGLYQLSAYIFDTFDLPNFEAYINEAKAILDLKTDSLQAMTAKAAETGNFEVVLTKTGEYSSLKYLPGVVIPYAYWIFLLAAFVAGTALTYLQVVVNPYLVACDVKGTSGVQRQSIAGAGNSLMNTLAPFFVAYIIFSGKSGLDININTLYIPILCLMILVFLIILFLKGTTLPSIASTEKKVGEVLPDSIFSFRHLVLGVVAIFTYVGVEVCIGANLNLFAMDNGILFAQAANMTMLYWSGLLIGRLFGSLFSKISGQTQLTGASAGAAILVFIAIYTNNPWFLVGVGLFHSIMWPAIFSLAIEGLGRYTSKGTGLLMMGVVGGAILPLLQGGLADYFGNWEYTWLIVAIGEIYLLYYALFSSRVYKRDVQQ